MNKSNLLANLAIAGIAAGMISVASVSAEDAAATAPVVQDTSKHAVKKHKHAKAHKDSSAAVATPAATVDTSAKAAPAVAAAKHSCKGMNSCKGQGGCHMDQAGIDAAAKKMGMPADKAGKAQDFTLPQVERHLAIGIALRAQVAHLEVIGPGRNRCVMARAFQVASHHHLHHAVMRDLAFLQLTGIGAIA
jgi:hypothetical protein